LPASPSEPDVHRLWRSPGSALFRAPPVVSDRAIIVELVLRDVVAIADGRGAPAEPCVAQGAAAPPAYRISAEPARRKTKNQVCHREAAIGECLNSLRLLVRRRVSNEN
jgi:hypothetical protein